MDENAVAKELLMLVGSHRLIFRVFDRCLDGKLLAAPEVKEITNRTLRLYRELLQQEGFTEEASKLEETW